jgi:TonB family protein
MRIVDPKEQQKMQKNKKQSNRVSKRRGGAGGKRKGRGDPKALTSVGVLKFITSRTKSSSHTAYELMTRQFQDVQKVINKLNVLKTTGESRIGERKGLVSAGWNDAISIGGPDGIDGLLEGLWGPGGQSRISATGKLPLPKLTELKMGDEIGLGQGGSRRSASSILRVVRQHMPGLRHTYNKYLKKAPGFKGKIHIRFEIAPSGSVVSVKIVSSTTGVAEFDYEVKNKVRRWRFDPITDKHNDVVTIPFTFSE